MRRRLGSLAMLKCRCNADWRLTDDNCAVDVWISLYDLPCDLQSLIILIFDAEDDLESLEMILLFETRAQVCVKIAV